MKPARLVGFVSGLLTILCLAFLYTQRSYLHFIVPQSAFAANSAQFFGTKFLDVGNTTFYLDPNANPSLLVSGNVGIGTTAPATKLEVIGDVNINNTSDPRDFLTISNGATWTTLIRVTNGVVSNPTTEMGLNASGDVYMEGNLGVGTTAPVAPLDVYNDSATNGELLAIRRQGAGKIGLSFQQNGSTAFGIVAQSDTNKGISFVQNYYEGSAGTDLMRITSAGNVGIGTTGPDTLLQIGDTAVNSAAYILFGKRTAATQTNKPFIGQDSYDATANDLGLGAISGNGGINFYTGNSATFFDPAKVRMRIDFAGNVGIGTTGPVNKLDVVGSFGRGAPVTKTANFTLAATENWIISSKATTMTVTLPAASSWTGREVTIKTVSANTVVSASSNVVPRTDPAAGTAILAATDGAWATLVSDGTNWVIMAGTP
jgi:hypothetical protein